MSAEKPQFNPQKVADTALEIFSEKGYLSASSLERALIAQGCNKKQVREIVTPFTGDLVNHIAEGDDARGHFLSDLDLRLNRTSVILESGESVTLYFSEANIKEEQAKAAYLADERKRQEELEARREEAAKEQAAKKEALNKPSRLQLVVVMYGPGTDAAGIKGHIDEAYGMYARADSQKREISDQAVDYDIRADQFITEAEARHILEHGATNQLLLSLIRSRRAKIITDAQILVAEGNVIADKLFNQAVEMLPSRRGLGILATSPLPEQYVLPLARAFREHSAHEQMENTVIVDSFIPNEYSFALQAAYAWIQRYDDPTLSAYRETIASLAKKGDKQSMLLTKILETPDAFAQLVAGQTVAIEGKELTRDNLDEILAPFILSDALLIRGIFADVVKAGFLTPEQKKGDQGEYFDFALAHLVKQFTPEEILAVLQKPVNTLPQRINTLKQEIANVKQQANEIRSKARQEKVKAVKERLDQDAAALDKLVPGLVQTRKDLEAEQTKPSRAIYNQIQAAVLEKLPANAPQERNVDLPTALYDLRRVVIQAR